MCMYQIQQRLLLLSDGEVTPLIALIDFYRQVVGGGQSTSNKAPGSP